MTEAKKDTKTEAKKTVKTSGPILTITSKDLSKDLITLEGTIRVASKSYRVIGEALNVINNLDLYKERGFKTFESYVEIFFDITRDYAYKMISAYRVDCILEESGFKPSERPINEAQCRPMASLDDKYILPVWDKVTESKKRITAKLINSICDIITGKADIKEQEKKEQEKKDSGNTPGNTDLVDGLPPVVTEGVKVYTEQEMAIIKAQLADAKQRAATAEAKLLTERKISGLPGGKLGRELVNAGFKALVGTLDDTQKAELLSIKKALLG